MVIDVTGAVEGISQLWQSWQQNSDWATDKRLQRSSLGPIKNNNFVTLAWHQLHLMLDCPPLHVWTRLAYALKKVDKGYKKVDKGYKKIDRGYKKVDNGSKKSWSLIDQPNWSAASMQHEIELHNKILASFQLFYQSITIYGVLSWCLCVCGARRYNVWCQR